MSPTVPPSSWQPLLAGADADRFRPVVHEIAAVLRPGAGRPAPGRGVRDAFNLAGGEAGQAIFFTYLDLAEPGQGHGDVAVELLELAIDGMGALAAGPALYGGFSGVAWAMEHLQNRLLDGGGEDPGEEVARELASSLAPAPGRRVYDLIGGL
ncbi:MAG TPA: hypothetical protein VGE98_00360, partial [Thermoanaerobaculia bacterium]